MLSSLFWANSIIGTATWKMNFLSATPPEYLEILHFILLSPFLCPIFPFLFFFFFFFFSSFFSSFFSPFFHFPSLSFSFLPFPVAATGICTEDLEVLFDSWLNISQQCAQAEKKASGICLMSDVVQPTRSRR